MQALLIFFCVMLTLNIRGSQKKEAQTCMQILVSQMKMDKHNEAIGTILGPFTLPQESTTINAYFKNVRLNFPHDVLKKIEKYLNERDFATAWRLLDPDMRQALRVYYRESALVMARAQQRAVIKNPAFAKTQAYLLIKKMITSYDLTIKMLEISAKNVNHHVETIELAILRIS